MTQEQSSPSGVEPSEAEVERAAKAVIAEWQVMSAELDGGRLADIARGFVSPGNYRLIRAALRAAYALRSRDTQSEPADPERSRHKAGMNGPGSEAPDTRAALVEAREALATKAVADAIVDLAADKPTYPIASLVVITGAMGRVKRIIDRALSASGERDGYVLVPNKLNGPLMDKLRDDQELFGIDPGWLNRLYSKIVAALAADDAAGQDKANG